MKINWFSPLEPARTGVAQYTRMIVPWLARHAEVCLWTTQPECDPVVLRNVKVCEYRVDAMPWKELNRAELTFFHMGNNVEFHLDIWLASMQYPGIVVLHDAFYPDFFNGVRAHMRNGDIDMRFVSRQAANPPNGAAELQAVLDGAVAAMVHSAAEFDRLAKTLTCPLLLAAFPYAPANETTLAAWASAPKPAGQKTRLVTFGYLNANRRVESILEVLAQFRSRMELHLHGPLVHSEAVHRKIRDLGLEGSVKISDGYVKDIDGALTRADLAINLRNPTMGEASLSQLQIWDHALPSIVTRTGWYGHLPEDSVVFVRPEKEKEDLAKHFSAYLEDPRRFAQIGANGRRTLLANHSPEEYAASLAGLSERTRSFQCGAAALSLGARVGKDMNRWFDPEYDGFTARIAAEIGQILG